MNERCHTVSALLRWLFCKTPEQLQYEGRMARAGAELDRAVRESERRFPS